MSQSVPGYRVALICVGIAFTLTGLYVGSDLALTLGLGTAIRATIIGSLVLCVMSVPAAVVGARTRLSTYMIVTNVFGNTGARLVNFVLAVVLLGWFAVTAELFGRTCYLTAAAYVAAVPPQWVFTVACSAIVIATTVFGFRAIDRLSLLVAPLLVVLTSYVAFRAVEHVQWAVLMAIPGTQSDLSTGISAVIGGMIVNVVLMPDVTRYSRSTFDCALISVTGNGIGAGGALILAMLPALAFHEEDPMKYMATLGLVGIAFATLVLSTWAVNAINLYSTGLVTSTAFRKTAYGRIVVSCGVLGTVVAVIGVADRLIGFLVLMGLVVPPIAGVYLADFFLLRRNDYTAEHHLEQCEMTNLNGIFACAAGGSIGILTYYLHASLTGVPTIESFVSAGLLYAGAERLRERTERDRRWRRLGAEPII
jgi:cytosine permease